MKRAWWPQLVPSCHCQLMDPWGFAWFYSELSSYSFKEALVSQMPKMCMFWKTGVSFFLSLHGAWQLLACFPKIIHCHPLTSQWQGLCLGIPFLADMLKFIAEMCFEQMWWDTQTWKWSSRRRKFILRGPKGWEAWQRYVGKHRVSQGAAGTERECCQEPLLGFLQEELDESG